MSTSRRYRVKFPVYGAASLVLLVAANRSGVWRGPMLHSVELIFSAAAPYDPKGFDELPP
jgi:hypothetical protein